MEQPIWIPAEVIGAPLDFTWNGTRDHIGPTETVTPLLNRLASKTTSAELCLCAGVVLWLAYRLEGHTQTHFARELAEATLAYQVDWRYCSADYASVPKTPDQPKADSALRTCTDFLYMAVDAKKWWNSYYQPVREVFHATHILQHTLSKAHKTLFATWLTATIERLDRVAKKPDEAFQKKKSFPSEPEYNAFVARHRGQALPPQVLDPARDYDPAERETLVDAFLRSLDWKANPLLRSPDEMRELAFEGTPYQLG